MPLLGSEIPLKTGVYLVDGGFMAFILVFLTFMSQSTFSQAETLQAKIGQLVAAQQKNSALHGNIEVRIHGETVFKKNMGVANDAFDVPNSDQSRFMIASISKQFTAAAVLKLAEQGLVNIDDLYSKYVPLTDGHPKTMARWDTFTIRDLLTHRAGIIRGVRSVGSYNPETYAPMLTALVDDMLSGQNIFHKKDLQAGSYSNFGYLLLAYLVEQVSGEEFHFFLQKHFWGPLELKSTGQYHRMLNIKYMTEGYVYRESSGALVRRCCNDATSFVGSHSLYSDLGDMMLWLDNLMAREPVGLSKFSMEQMMSQQTSMRSEEANYGLGFFIDEVRGFKRVWHDGSEDGYLSLVSMVPDLGIQIVILGNRHVSVPTFDQVYTRVLNDQIVDLISSYNQVSSL